MNRYCRYFAVSLLVSSVLMGCKKNDNSTTNPNLTGLYLSDVPTYVAPGEIIKVDADVSSLTTSDRSNPGVVGLYWQVNTAKRDTLTENIALSNPTYTYKADTLGNYTVFCYAYAKDYYTTSASVTFSAIDPDTALSGIEIDNIEILDGNLYGTVEVGGETWLANNLYTEGLGISYATSSVTDSVFGRYYSWEEAQIACPAGWHLPTAEEFDACLGTDAGSLMANAYFLEKEMWEYWPGVTITNLLGFNALPVGYWDKNNKVAPFNSFKSYAAWWTASGDITKGGEFRYIYDNLPEVQQGWGDISTLYMSVRCVKD